MLFGFRNHNAGTSTTRPANTKTSECSEVVLTMVFGGLSSSTTVMVTRYEQQNIARPRG